MDEQSIDSGTGLEVLVKQPEESRLYSMDFTNLLVDGQLELIRNVGLDNQHVIEGSEDVVIEEETIVGSAVWMRISGGVAGENYKVTVRIQDSRDNILEGEGILYVRER